MENDVLGKLAEKDILDIAAALTLHSYSIHRLGMQNLFQKMAAEDYVTLSRLVRAMKEGECDRLYLSQISQELGLPIGRVSRTVRLLKERGLVLWTHDGTGSDGTYIQITDNGLALLKEQQEALARFYADVIGRFGKERFMHLLEELDELEKTMNGQTERSAMNEQ